MVACGMVLQLANVQRLQPLLDVLHLFIMTNTREGCRDCLLCGVVGLVFSDAVLEAALGSSTLSKEAYISSVLSQPCSLTPGAVGHSSVLKPVGDPIYFETSKVLMFDAQLLRDFVGGKGGDTVEVTLDLFGHACGEGLIRFQLPKGSSAVALPVQLLLGHSVSNADTLQELLQPDAD
jgi:hypothetical protein